MDSRMLKGQCLCGEVAFELDLAQVVLFNNCYCKRCQRNSGAAFVSQLQVPKTSFHWLQGDQSIQLYESSPGVNRAFCGVCGSRLPMTEIDGDFVPVPVGLLDEDPGLEPEVNMHLQERPSWVLVNEKIHCLNDHGSPEFWAEFSEGKQGDA
jgi:hypothetical protein